MTRSYSRCADRVNDYFLLADLFVHACTFTVDRTLANLHIQAMIETLTKRGTAQSLASLFAILAEIQQRDMTAASAQAVILTAAGTVDMGNPRPATPGDVAKALDMSPSAVTRLMAKLAGSGGPSLLEPVPGPTGSRAEGYVLTPRGRDFVAALLSALNGRPVDWPETHTVATFSQTKDSDGPVKLRKVRWDEASHTVVVTPAEAALSDEVQEWANEFLSEKPTITVTKEGAVLAFAAASDAMYFVLRWC
jgi:DNA-binding MarR family transcriptional regulator